MWICKISPTKNVHILFENKNINYQIKVDPNAHIMFLLKSLIIGQFIHPNIKTNSILLKLVNEYFDMSYIRTCVRRRQQMHGVHLSYIHSNIYKHLRHIKYIKKT